jgi:hypothetical protein
MATSSPSRFTLDSKTWVLIVAVLLLVLATTVLVLK